MFSLDGKLNEVMFHTKSIQGQPVSDCIYLYREGQDQAPEIICSTGHYYSPKNTKEIPMAANLQCRAFAIANQFNSYGMASPKNNAGTCCDYRSNFFEYQGTRIPTCYANNLLQIFDQFAQK